MLICKRMHTCYIPMKTIDKNDICNYKSARISLKNNVSFATKQTINEMIQERF